MKAFDVIRHLFRFLTFRGLKLDQPGQLNFFLVLGLIFTWLAGIGRYWDHPSAEIWQYAGLGSVVYVFVLAGILWGIAYPLRPETWRYKTVLTFVALTSPLAWLYAIPVERFMPLETAISVNIWFLAVVAMWRVMLLVQFLKSYGQFSSGTVFVLTFLPLTLIMAALSLLNLEQAVFEIMAGIGDERSGTQQIHDAVYAQIVVLGMLSILGFVCLLAVYLTLISQFRKSR